MPPDHLFREWRKQREAKQMELTFLTLAESKMIPVASAGITGVRERREGSRETPVSVYRRKAG